MRSQRSLPKTSTNSSASGRAGLCSLQNCGCKENASTSRKPGPGILTCLFSCALHPSMTAVGRERRQLHRPGVPTAGPQTPHRTALSAPLCICLFTCSSHTRCLPSFCFQTDLQKPSVSAPCFVHTRSALFSLVPVIPALNAKLAKYFMQGININPWTADKHDLVLCHSTCLPDLRRDFLKHAFL